VLYMHPMTYRFLVFFLFLLRKIFLPYISSYFFNSLNPYIIIFFEKKKSCIAGFSLTL
jgi:hypothetical protein